MIDSQQLPALQKVQNHQVTTSPLLLIHQPANGVPFSLVENSEIGGPRDVNVHDEGQTDRLGQQHSVRVRSSGRRLRDVLLARGMEPEGRLKEECPGALGGAFGESSSTSSTSPVRRQQEQVKSAKEYVSLLIQCSPFHVAGDSRRMMSSRH